MNAIISEELIFAPANYVIIKRCSALLFPKTLTLALWYFVPELLSLVFPLLKSVYKYSIAVLQKENIKVKRNLLGVDVYKCTRIQVIVIPLENKDILSLTSWHPDFDVKA